MNIQRVYLKGGACGPVTLHLTLAYNDYVRTHGAPIFPDEAHSLAA